MMRLAMRSALASAARLIARGFLGDFDTLSPRPEDSISYFNDGEKWKPEAMTQRQGIPKGPSSPLAVACHRMDDGKQDPGGDGGERDQERDAGLYE